MAAATIPPEAEGPEAAGPESTGRRPPAHRRRFLAGVAVAVALAVGFGADLKHRSREADLQQRAERSAVISLSALADLVESASLPTEEVTADFPGLGAELAAPADPAAGEKGGLGIGDALDAPAEPADGETGETVRQAVRLFAERHPEIPAVRVVFFDGRQLAASTAPEDTGAGGERAAPRRLTRAEKPLYDLGQSLRAAVAGNREDAAGPQAGGRRRPELAVARRPGALVLTAPVERDTAVVGLVQIEAPPPPRLPGAGWILLQALLAAAGAALLFWLLSLVLRALLSRDHRWALAAAAVLLLAAALAAFRSQSLDLLERGRREDERALAAHLTAERQKATEVLAATGGAVTALDPGHWDVDAFRRPRGLVAADGTVSE